MQQLKNQQQSQQQQQQLLDSPGQESPSTSCQISAPATSQDNDKRLLDFSTPTSSSSSSSSRANKQQQQTHQHHQPDSLDSSGRYNTNNTGSNRAEDQSLLASSGYRSQASVDFLRSGINNHNNNRTPLSSESRRLIDKTFCGCCTSNNNNNNTIMSRSSRLILSYFIAEMLGTFILVLIGDGSIASYVVMKHPVDVFNACFAFGVGAMIATFLAFKISGAHLNPAATVAIALDGKLKWRLVPVYILAQYLGGFMAALLLYVNYIEAISALDGGTRSAFGSTNSTGNIFATYPSEWVSVWGSLLDQIVGTATLLFALSAVTDKNNVGLDERHQPLIVAFVIGLICFAFSPNCGAIFNPARDLAPRLLCWLVGYSNDVWSPINGYYWLTAGVIGPHIGAILGYFGYKFLIGSSLNNKRQYELDQQGESHCHGSGHSMNCVSDNRKQTPAAKLVQISQHNQNQNHHHHHLHSTQQQDHIHQQQQHQSSPNDTANYGSAKR